MILAVVVVVPRNAITPERVVHFVAVAVVPFLFFPRLVALLVGVVGMKRCHMIIKNKIGGFTIDRFLNMILFSSY